MAGERVARIDRFEFVPEAPRFFDLADMTEGGGEERPRRIGIRRQHETLLEDGGRRLVFPGRQISHAEELEPLLAEDGIKPHIALHLRDRFERATRKQFDAS